MASVPQSESASVQAIDDLLATAGIERIRAGRKRISGRHVDRQDFKLWPRAGKITKSGGLELLQSPLFLRGPADAKRTAAQGKSRGAASRASLPWLRHAFSTRVGGVSRVYQSDAETGGDLNLSWTTEDDPALVAENRRRFVAAAARSKSTGSNPLPQLVTLRQIHSGLVHVFREDGGGKNAKRPRVAPAYQATKQGRAVLKGDGMMTDRPGLLLGIQTADCIPVLVADPRRKAVAAFHAGWRGTLARIVERGVGAMRLEYGSDPRDLIAAIGPGIGPCCYSIGEEVRHEFESQFIYADELFSEVYDRDPIREKYPMLFLTQRAPGHSNIGPQTHLDLWQANLRQLLDAGIPRTNITVTGECTACNPQRYFSHRAQQGFTGRMLNVVGVV